MRWFSRSLFGMSPNSVDRNLINFLKAIWLSLAHFRHHTAWDTFPQPNALCCSLSQSRTVHYCLSGKPVWPSQLSQRSPCSLGPEQRWTLGAESLMRWGPPARGERLLGALSQGRALAPAPVALIEKVCSPPELTSAKWQWSLKNALGHSPCGTCLLRDPALAQKWEGCFSWLAPHRRHLLRVSLLLICLRL